MLNIPEGTQEDQRHPLLIEANKAAQARDYVRGIQLLQEANRRSPRNPNILFNLATMQARRYDFAAVEKSLEQAVEVSPDKGQALIAAGLRCLAMSNSSIAEKYFTRAAELPNPNSIAFAGLSESYWRREKYTEAMEFTERALRLDPNCQPALLLQGRLLRLAGRLKEAEAALRPLVGNTDRKLRLRVAAGGELALVLDQQKNYDAAMATMVRAKALLDPPGHITQSYASLCERRRALEESGLAGRLEKWFKMERQPIPFVLTGGRPYSSENIGVEHQLASHDGIFYLEDSRIFLDEVYFPIKQQFPPGTPFVQIFDSLTPDQITEMRSIFLKRNEDFLQKPIGNRLIVEKNHILNALMLARVRIFPETQFLMMVRDPRDMCLESFMQVQPVNPCSCAFLTLDGSVEENVATMKHWRNVMEIVGTPHMQVKLEDIVANHDVASEKIFSFLKLAPQEPSKPFTPSWGIGNWKNYRKYLEPHLPVLNKLAEAFGY